MPHQATRNPNEKTDMARTPTVRKTLLTLIVTAACAACASNSAFRSTPEADRAQGASSDVITTTELQRLDPGLSMMAAVEHARPWFLHPRGSVSTASIDYSPPAELAVLRTITVGDVREVRLLRAGGGSGAAAIRSDGSVALGDVILVITAARRP